MGKTLFRVSLAALVAVLVVVVANRFDGRESRPAYGENDLPPSSLDPENGAFWLLFLGEPEADGLDIGAKTGQYLEWLANLRRVERLTWQVRPQTKPLGGRYWQILKDIPFPAGPDLDWPGFLGDHGPRLEDVRIRLAVLLERFERLLGSEMIADFGYDREWDRPYALISFVTATARFYSALRVLDGSKGKYGEAARGLLAELRVGEKLAAASQSLFFHALARSFIEVSLEALAGLLGGRDCPADVRREVFEALSPLTPESYSLRGPFIGEYLWMTDRVRNGDRWLQSELAFRELLPGREGEQVRAAVNIFMSRELGPQNYLGLREAAFQLFLMKNRTLAYFEDSLAWLLSLDGTPPNLWTDRSDSPPSFRGFKLWWLWNPAGKLLYEGFGPAYQRRTVERKFRTRALYDLVRISAEMRWRDSEAGAAGGGTSGLESFRAADPFSGQPYMWDAATGTLRSVGPDGRDDRMGGAGPEGRGDDIVIPVRLNSENTKGRRGPGARGGLDVDSSGQRMNR